jgi:putative aldouronate transport system permease protein
MWQMLSVPWYTGLAYGRASYLILLRLGFSNRLSALYFLLPQMRWQNVLVNVVYGRRWYMITSRYTKIWYLVIALFYFFVILICLFPMLNLLARSLSDPIAIVNRRVSFLPVDVTLDSYRYIFRDKSFSRSMIWTAMLTAMYTLISLTITILCAYPLTYDYLKGRKIINTIIIFTMYFNPGIIPDYILMKNLGLLNNPLVLILPNCLSVFNMIILRSFFYSVPGSIRESAELDGANPFIVLVQIYLPLSTPVLATLALFYAVSRWNGFSDALLYLNSVPTYHPIQLKLYNIINNLSSIKIDAQDGIAGGIPMTGDGVKAAAIMFATVPILVLYPWLQRYFIKGVTIGAVKS